MKVKITVLPDTKGWEAEKTEELARAKRGESTRGFKLDSGLQDGFWMIVDESEVMDRLGSIHGLGHKSEVEYLKED
jgi:hypothetical protein